MSGSPKPGWIELKFDNAGVEIHMVGMVALKNGVTAKQMKKALLSDDENAGANLVVGDGEVLPTPGLLGPGEKATNIMELKAGRYGLFCFIPAPDGKSHVEHGMVKVFDIKGSKSTFTPPADGVVELKLTETSATLPSTLPRSSTLKITNDAGGPRSLNFVRLIGGTTIQQADEYFGQLFEGEAPAGDPPATLVGGADGIAPGSTTYIQLTLDAGSYGYANEDSQSDDDPAPVLGGFTVS